MIKMPFEIFKDMLLQRAGELEIEEELYIPDSVIDFVLEYIQDAGEVGMSIDDVLHFLAYMENQNLDTLRETISEIGI